MAKTENVSPKFSFKGWNFKTWVSKNKDSLKLIVSGVAGLGTAFAVGLSPTWSAFAGTLVAAGSKLVLDSLDYYTSQVAND